MAKRSKVKVEPQPLEQYSKGDDILIVSNTHFIYEVEVYVLAKGSFNLEDSKLIKKLQYKKPGREKNKVKGLIVYQDYKLIGAPRSWLIDNFYSPI